MIDLVTGNKPLPASIRLDIIERTDGIPLFVEEMTKAVLEAESQGDAQQTAAAIPPSAPAVPASLHASLMARLDRLGSAKDVAQIGAAIGREFTHRFVGGGGGRARGRTPVGARPSDNRRLAIPAGSASPCNLPVQARSCARCGLWDALTRPATCVTCSHRRNA